MTSVLSDRAPLLLERLDVAAGEATARRTRGQGESFLYVIDGDGALELPDATHPLAPESVVWLEPGDSYRLAAGESGLAVLAATVEEGSAE